MPNARSLHPVMHARSSDHRSARWAGLAGAALIAGVTIPAPAQTHHRGVPSTHEASPTAVRSATSQSAGRYRDYGRLRGGSSQRPQAQQPLGQALSGILPPGFGGYQAPARQQPATAPTRMHHRHPQVIYVPIGYASPAPSAPQPVIVVQQALRAPPQPPPVMIVQPPLGPAQAFERPAPAAPERPAEARSRTPGMVHFSILPAGAVVVFDDRPLGLAGTVEQRRGLSTAPGIHLLEVSHPEHQTERLVFAIEPASDVRVTIDLRETRPSRRTRIE